MVWNHRCYPGQEDGRPHGRKGLGHPFQVRLSQKTRICAKRWLFHWGNNLRCFKVGSFTILSPFCLHIEQLQNQFFRTRHTQSLFQFVSAHTHTHTFPRCTCAPSQKARLLKPKQASHQPAMIKWPLPHSVFDVFGFYILDISWLPAAQRADVFWRCWIAHQQTMSCNWQSLLQEEIRRASNKLRLTVYFGETKLKEETETSEVLTSGHVYILHM